MERSEREKISESLWSSGSSPPNGRGAGEVRAIKRSRLVLGEASEMQLDVVPCMYIYLCVCTLHSRLYVCNLGGT